MSLVPVVGMETEWDVDVHLEYLYPCLEIPCCLMLLGGWTVLLVAGFVTYLEIIDALMTLLFVP